MVFIVTIAVPAEEFRRSLEGVAGVRFVRELPPGRVVVTAAGSAVVTALPAVEAVIEDRLEHLTD